MYSGEALGCRRSPRRRKRERAAVFAAPPKPPRLGSEQAPPGRARRIARICGVIAVMFALGASIPKAYSGLQGSDLFKLKEISVIGSHLLTPEEIVLRSGLTEGTNLFDANLITATDSLVAHPLIRSALLLRRPPDSLVISVEERVPIALVSTRQGLLGFDRDAMRFELPNVPFDLPIVTGLEAILADSTFTESGVRQRVARFIELAQMSHPDFWSRVSEICVMTADEGDLILADGMTLKVRFDHISDQIRNYRAFMASGDVLPEDLAYIDLRYVNQVVAGRRPADLQHIGSVPFISGTPD